MVKNKYLNLVLLVFLIGYSISGTGQNNSYAEVSVKLNTITEIQSLANLGLAIDHYQGNIEDGIRFFVSPEEVQLLRDNGFDFEITIANYTTFYKELQIADRAANPNPTKGKNVADGFDLGSMGGFYTFSEIEDKLDEMKTNYPNLISSKVSIGTSIEGRPIWMVKISDNPEMDEEEPTVYFDALHHAREPLAMASTINYMFWLLENYSTDTSVKFLVDNREIYFVPVVNPDGYVYNETTHPDGGGLWRKNRRPITFDCTGVDLNRNYGFSYGINDDCSSPDPCSGIYRGKNAFSEPETAAIRDFLMLIQPETAFSTHSTAGTYLMPYGFDTSPPAFDIYSEWASAFLNENDYTYGVTAQMLGYTSCGTTRDYLHSEGIYGWTPEIDGQGFWPPESTILDLVGENVRPFYYQTFIAGAYLDVQSHQLIGNVVPGESFQLAVAVKNVGVGATAENVSVIVSANDNDIISPTASDFGSIEARNRADNLNNPFNFFIEESFDAGFFKISVTTVQDGAVNGTFEIPVFIGEKETIFIDTAENGAADWTALGNGISWGVNQDDSYSGDSSFGDSDNGNSQNNTDNSFTLNLSFDFSVLVGPFVQFAAKHALEEGDIARFQISTNGGADWITLKSFANNESWRIHTFNLSEYDSSSVLFRFALTTDGSIPGDGFYFDDFEIYDYTQGILTITETEIKSKQAIYPNPFTNFITIETATANTISEIKLFDILGKEIPVEIEQTSNNIIISGVSELRKGVYILTLIDEETKQQLVKRLIKD